MDGSRTVAEIWAIACDRLGDEAPTQDEVIELIGSLHRADVLVSGVTPDLPEQEARRRNLRRASALGTAIRPATAVAVNASHRLRIAGCTNCPLSQALTYQRSENPCGGNTKNERSLKLNSTTTASGMSMKA